VLSYRLSDVPSSMSAAQAREIAIRVITRRLASHRLVNRVDPGAAADEIDVHVARATPAQVAAIVEASGVNLTIWKWVPGQVDEATQSRLGPLAAQYHPGYRPVFTGIDGTMVIHATVGQATRPPGPGVIVPFDPDGAELLNLVTRDRAAQTYDTVENRLAVFIDSRLFEDADVSAEITKGAMLLVPDVGTFTSSDAEQLADALNAGTIPGKLTRLSRTSSATSAP
jgi:preprotein translocase subunit SecD